MSDMNYRNSFEFPAPNRKTVALYLSLSKTSDERKVWRDLLNSEAFHKPKTIPLTKEQKKERKDAALANKSKPKKK